MSVLDEFRTRGPCELCGVMQPRREPHHAFTRGAGGKDIRENLVALGPHDTPWVCCCHRRVHDGHIPRRCVLSVIALREGRTLEEIEYINNEARRL